MGRNFVECIHHSLIVYKCARTHYEHDTNPAKMSCIYVSLEFSLCPCKIQVVLSVLCTFCKTDPLFVFCMTTAVPILLLQTAKGKSLLLKNWLYKVKPVVTVVSRYSLHSSGRSPRARLLVSGKN